MERERERARIIISLNLRSSLKLFKDIAFQLNIRTYYRGLFFFIIMKNKSMICVAKQINQLEKKLFLRAFQLIT